jgi:hypothetical protein
MLQEQRGLPYASSPFYPNKPFIPVNRILCAAHKPHIDRSSFSSEFFNQPIHADILS